MSKKRRRYEVEFTACLLACGRLPKGSFHDNSAAHFKSETWQVREEYQWEVMQWWIDWHGNTNTPPTEKSQFRFYKKFRTWQKIYLRRNRDEDV